MYEVKKTGLGFFARLSRGWKMTRLGMHVVRADPELMVYMLLSGFLSIIAFVALLSITGGLGMITGSEDITETSLMLGTFFGYMVAAIITVFWNAAIVASAYLRLTTGTNPSFSYGIGRAWECRNQIFVWGLVSGTVGIIIQFFEGMAQSDNPAVAIIGSIARIILSAAWWMTTFFVVPMIVLDKMEVRECMKESPELFKKTWGEDVGMSATTGILNFLVILLVVLLCLPFMLFGEIGMGFGIGLMIIGIGLSALFFSTVEAVNRAGLFYYARTGESPPMAEKYDLHY